MKLEIIDMGLYRKPKTQRELMDFVIWAKDRFPEFTTKYKENVKARWAYRKYLREAHSMS
jgi:hypothetical protein